MSSAVVDRITEAGSRWLARRTTRRSFLGTAGTTMLVAAGGTTISAVFASRAEARVCGQSGVSPKCPTFDCVPPDFWGWCWYAGNASCCADGGLKKICDCCRSNYPNVQGYCPDGSSVYCIVESCLEDPRVQRVALDRWISTTAGSISAERVAARVADGAAPTVVVAGADDPFLAAIASPVAADLGVPLLLTRGDALDDSVGRQLDRLGTRRVIAVGGGLAPAVVDALAARGTLDRLADTAVGAAAVSIEMAAWMIARTGRRELVAIGPGSASVPLLAPAGGLASVRRIPVVVSAEAVAAVRARVGEVAVTWVGPESGAPASPAAGDRVVADPDPSATARALVQLALDAEPAAQFRVAVLQAGGGAIGAAMISPGMVTLVTGGPDVDPVMRDWLIARSARFASAEISLAPSAALHAQGTYTLQSSLNGFAAHLLTGVSGMGLPVVAQPMPERAVGAARVRPPWPGRSPAPIVSRVKKGP
jgi:hypothetical protein